MELPVAARSHYNTEEKKANRAGHHWLVEYSFKAMK
jgi:hypothetical protein